MKNGFELLSQLQSDPTSYAKIAEIFNLCSVPSSAAGVIALSSTVNSALGTMVMVDYPYPTSFIEPLPAWPVNFACQQAAEAKASHATDPLADLYAMAAAGNVFYNYNN
jgi:lysosomal Pro-X carboxypeptidase